MRLECIVSVAGRTCMPLAPSPRTLARHAMAYVVGRTIEAIVRHALSERDALTVAGDDPMLAFS